MDTQPITIEVKVRTIPWVTVKDAWEGGSFTLTDQEAFCEHVAPFHKLCTFLPTPRADTGDASSKCFT